MMAINKFLRIVVAIATLILTLIEIYSFFIAKDVFAETKVVNSIDKSNIGAIEYQRDTHIDGSVNNYRAKTIGNIDAKSNNVQNNINCLATGHNSTLICGNIHSEGDTNINTGK